MKSIWPLVTLMMCVGMQALTSRARARLEDGHRHDGRPPPCVGSITFAARSKRRECKEKPSPR